jgi:hypothetical protein
MIIFTISLDPDPLKQIISDPAGSGSGSTTLPKGSPMYDNLKK